MSEYKYYENGFTENSRMLINEIIKLKADKRILDLITQIDEDKAQVFNYSEIEKVYFGIKEGYSFDDIKLYVKHHKGHSIYNTRQMDCIMYGISKDYPREIIDIYAKLGPDMEPVYDSNYMDLIIYALRNEIPVDKIKDTIKLNIDNKTVYDYKQTREIFEGIIKKSDKESIDFYSQLNSIGKPIYTGTQMSIIRQGINFGLPLEYIKIYAKCKDEKPIYNTSQMDEIRISILKAFNANEINRIIQLKECIDKEFTFDQLHPLLSYDVPPENIRLYRSLYDLGLTVEDAEKMIAKNEPYKDLKDLKYLLKCAKEFNINDIRHILEDRELSLVGSLAASRDISNHDELELIERFLSFKMPPDQIKYITNKDYSFSYKEMKEIAIGFLHGLEVQEVDDIVSHINDNYLGNTIGLLKEGIKETLKNKINAPFILEEEMSFETYFNEHERGE